MRVFSLLLLTLIVLPCVAEPARQPRQLKSLSLEQLGIQNNRRVVEVCERHQAHLAGASKKHSTIAFDDGDLRQPHPREFTGDNGNAMGIQRRLYASLTSRP